MRTAVALVNTMTPPDTLTTVGELEGFFRTWDYTGRHNRTGAELAEVRATRARLLMLLRSDRDDAVELINEWLAEAQAVPQLVRHGDVDWHVHGVRGDEPLAQRILVESAIAMIDLVRADEMSRLKPCAAAGCEGVVLDLTRNRSRVFCSSSCTNRASQAAYRARQNH